MARISLPAAPAFLRGLGPPVLLRIGAAALAAISLVAGFAVLATAWPTGAWTAEQAAAAPDSTFSLAGTVARLWAEGADAVTHVRMAGAPDLDLRIAGNAIARFSPGDFVVVVGAKTGSQFEVHSARVAIARVDIAAPYLAAGAVLSALLAVDFLVRWSRTGPSKGPRRWRIPLPRWRHAARAPPEAKPAERAAPAPER